MPKRNPNIARPSIEQVKHYLDAWEKLENYRLQETALNKLFSEICKGNTDLSNILIKVAALNDFYSTNIFSVFPVAKHIKELNIDSRLQEGDVQLVSEIQRVKIDKSNKNFYSFATKYCSHHNEAAYPIYDSYVGTMLCYFKRRDRFFEFVKEDLRNYEMFKTIIMAFCEFYALEGFSLKEIDRYLWLLGKKFFPKKYSARKKNNKRYHS